MKTVQTSATRGVAIYLAFLLVIVVTACSSSGSMNPYLGSVTKLLPADVGTFKRVMEAGEVNTRGFIDEMQRGMNNAAAAKYVRPNEHPLNPISASAYGFVSAARAKEAVEFMKQRYLKQNYTVKEDGARKKGWSTVGETIVLTRGPQGYALWRDGSVVFSAEAFSKNQVQDIMEFEKNFPY